MKNPTIDTYNLIAADYSKSFHEKPEEIQMIKQFSESISGQKKILDVGCGNCDYFDLFEDAGINYSGIDLSEEMINIANHLHPTGNFMVQDILSMSYPDMHFNGIFSFYSLIHIPKKNIPFILNRFNKMLIPAGIILLSLQEGVGEKYVISPYSKTGKLFLNLFQESEIRQLLNNAGFNVIDFKRYSGKSDNVLPFHKLLILASKIQHTNSQKI